MKKYLLALAMALAMTGSAVADMPAPMRFLAARGGAVSAPVAAEEYFYISTGSTVTAWQRGVTGTIALVGDTRRTPVGNQISSLQRRGDYLYASFGRSPSTGVAVYSIADRARPLLLGSFQHSNEIYRDATRLQLVGDQLYLFDRDYGIYASSLANPAQLQFVRLAQQQWVNDRFDVVGNRLYNSGMGETGASFFGAFDVTDPSLPLGLGYTPFSCCDFGPFRVRGDYAYSFGTPFSVLDARVPANLQVVAQLPDIAPGYPVMLDSHAWSIRPGSIDVIDVSDPTQPQLSGSHAFPAQFLELAERVGDSVLVAQDSNRLLRYAAAQEAAPVLTGQAWLPGAYYSKDVAVRDDKILVTEYAGIGLLDRASLDRLDFQTIPFNGYAMGGYDMAVEGDRAYVLHYKTGFSVVDITDPGHIASLGYWRAEMETFAVHDGLVYASFRDYQQTPSSYLSVIDMNAPAAPLVLGTMQLPAASQMVVRGDRLFASVQGTSAVGGLRIVDISNPAAPVQIGSYTGCSSRGLAVNRRGDIALLACDGKLDIVDVGDPVNPVLLHRRTGTWGIYSVEIHGDRAYFPSEGKLLELDVSNPAQPVQIHQFDSACFYVRLGSDARLYCLGVGVYTLEPDRLFADGLDP